MLLLITGDSILSKSVSMPFLGKPEEIKNLCMGASSRERAETGLAISRMSFQIESFSIF